MTSFMNRDNLKSSEDLDQELPNPKNGKSTKKNQVRSEKHQIHDNHYCFRHCYAV